MINVIFLDNSNLTFTIIGVPCSSESPTNIAIGSTIADASPSSGVDVAKQLLREQMKKINAHRPLLPYSNRRPTKRYKSKLVKSHASLSGGSLTTLMRPLSPK
ncbi:hypothetical protein V6N13_008039 [Hibiscus sabdariffa]